MNVLYINGSYYKFPANTYSLPSFLSHAEKCDSLFMPLERFETENCVYPYFINEDTKITYVNISFASELEEEEIVVLGRQEYEKRLYDCVDNVCRYCANYSDETDEDPLKGHRNKINLDGKCYWFEKI